MRDDFSVATKELLAKRVAHRCSNPQCRQVTSGPQEDPTRVVNIGVAAHITAASPDGPRYDSGITTDERSSPNNGIWLCQSCAKLVDNDQNRYPTDVLRQWKTQAEAQAARALERRNIPEDAEESFAKLEGLMTDLLAEMRKDIRDHPLKREFIVAEKWWTIIDKGTFLAYYFEEHEDLRDKIQILENFGLINNVTYNSVPRYRFTEKFVAYLASK